jgi:hypothetical protein
MKAPISNLRMFFSRQKPLAAMAAGGLILLSLAVRTNAAEAAPLPAVTVQSNQTTEDFPNTITFQLKIHSSAAIQQIVLEYGANQTTCGDVTGMAYPDFQAGTDVTAEWTWDMRQSGSEPPGATIWWQWRVTDSDGNETLIDKKESLWLDSQHPWKSLTGGGVTLHWYRTDAAFGKQMHDTATKALTHIHDLIDLQPQGAIDIYLYNTFDELGAAVLYEPGWTGGLSFGGYNIIILGIPSGEESWGMGAIAHELMHTVVDDATFSCLVEIPTWLNEGLAMVSQGGPGAQELANLQNAIKQNTIFPLHGMGGNFPEDADQAQLAYDESYSVVNYLIQTGGAAKMRSLLTSLSGGMTIDDGLNSVYGFNVDGLDAAWRQSVGAQPLPASQLEPTATPTVVPTFEPLSVNPAATLAASPTATVAASTATSIPAFTPTNVVSTPTPSPGLVPSGSTSTVLVICVWMLCLALVIAAGATMIILVTRRRR